MKSTSRTIFDGHIKIGGVEQYINICGKDVRAPILLLVHGGPGFSDMAFAYHGYNRLLEERFLVVNWDQRGTGRSFSESIPSGSITVEQLVLDGGEVTEWLCRQYGQDKIFLRGHSWGGYLGMKIIERFPQFFHACFALSPFVDFSLSEPLSYRFAVEQAGSEDNQEALLELKEIGPPPYQNPMQALQIQRKWLDFYGGMVYGGRGRSGRLFALFTDIPGYTENDYKNAVRGQEVTTGTLFKEGLQRSLMQEVKAVNIPVFIGVGRFDYLNCFAVTSQYLESLAAPAKELIWFENSAHFPQFSEADRFQEILIDRFFTLLR
jgi:pimeloyl-ACP methyl ester carboxylesterase